METQARIIKCIKKLYTATENKHFSYCSYPVEDCCCRNIDNITSKTSLVNEGYIDSMGIMLLVIELENEFSITINEKYIIPLNFDTIEKIEILIKKIIEG